MTSRLENLVAEDITEELLYRTGLALVEGRLDGVEDCFLLPHSMETTEGVRIVRTPEDVRRMFEEVRSYFADSGVVNIVRTVVEARFVSDTEVESVHVSRLWRNSDERPETTYPVFSVIRLCDDRKWRIAHSNYAITESRSHGSALLARRAKAES